MSAHAAVLVAHVLFSALTIGATVAYAVWIAIAEREPEHLAFTIRAVRRSDRVLAIPAFAVTFVTGVWLAYDGGIPLERPWLAASIALWLVVLVVGLGVFGPTVRRELAALARGGVGDADYPRLRRRARALSLGTIAALGTILALMIAKPF